MNKYQWILSTTLVAVVVASLYGPALVYGYVWDDLIWLEIVELSQQNLFKQAFLEPFLYGNRYWRPFGALTLYFQIGAKPEIYQHLINILLHVINLSILSALAWRRYRLSTQPGFPSLWFVILLMFAIHPAFVEPVVWISGRFDLLVTTFLLLSLGVYWVMGQSQAKLWILSACYVFALLTKETAVLLLPLLILFSQLINPAGTMSELLRRERTLVALFFLLTMGYLFFRALVLGDYGMELILSEKQPLPFHEKIYEVLATLGAYLRIVLFPFLGLSSLHPASVILSNPLYPVAGGLYLAITAGALLVDGLVRRIGYILGGFVVSLLLVLNILPEGFTGNLIQNRYIYPSLAFVLCCVLTSSDVRLGLSFIAKKSLGIVALAWLVLAGLNVKVTVPLWQSQEILTSWFASENPASTMAINLRGGQQLVDGDLAGAIKTVGEEASRIPTFDGYAILAMASVGLGMCQDALVYFDYAFQLGYGRQKSEVLLSKHHIYSQIDPSKAEEAKNLLLRLVGPDQSYIERLDLQKNSALKCKD